MIFIDLIGKKFNKLTVLKFIGDSKYQCQCDCGNINVIRTTHLISGHTKSCGCLKKEPKTKTHGMRKTRFYNTWCSIKKRCFSNTRKDYKNYGGRGITVCESWLKFENFKEDMYESYLNHVEEFGEKETTIDRIDNGGNYELANCRWATSKEQNNNRRPRDEEKIVRCHQRFFKAISQSGEEIISNNQSKFSRDHSLSVGHLNSCLVGDRKSHKGWSFYYIEVGELDEAVL